MMYPDNPKTRQRMKTRDILLLLRFLLLIEEIIGIFDQDVTRLAAFPGADNAV